MAQDHLDLDARQVRTHTEVLAEAERKVRVRPALHAEPERLVEDFLVAVRRREVERELVAGPDLPIAQDAVLRGDPREVTDRARPAQDLVDRVGHELGALAQALPLISVLTERQQSSADRVARDLVCRLLLELTKCDELFLR